jgi:hypothetical protein
MNRIEALSHLSEVERDARRREMERQIAAAEQTAAAKDGSVELHALPLALRKRMMLTAWGGLIDDLEAAVCKCDWLRKLRQSGVTGRTCEEESRDSYTFQALATDVGHMSYTLKIYLDGLEGCAPPMVRRLLEEDIGPGSALTEGAKPEDEEVDAPTIIG